MAGLIYGSWVNGVSVWLIAFYLTAFLNLLAFGLYLVNKRNLKKLATSPAAASQGR
jgi:hypothetical protein